ncbi:MAG: hypothetical protein ACOYM3_34695, partial [Terrimicrobiaceae bacterium]
EGVGFGEGSAGFKGHNTLIIRIIKQYLLQLPDCSLTTRRDTFRDTKWAQKKVPPERPCGEQCGGPGAQSPHQIGQVFMPEKLT